MHLCRRNTFWLSYIYLLREVSIDESRPYVEFFGRLRRYPPPLFSLLSTVFGGF